MRILATVAWGALMGAPGWCQTQIHLPSQSRRVDFSAASSTKPAKTGANLPATCTPGEQFFKTGAPSGLHGCTATNTWTSLTGARGLGELTDVSGKQGNGSIVPMWSGPAVSENCIKIDANGNLKDAGAPCRTGEGSPMTAELGDLAVARASNTILTIGAGCSTSKPCRIRQAGVVHTVTSSATVTVSAGTPTVRIYVSDGSDGAAAGTLKVRNSTSSGVTCTGCTVENSQTSFPDRSFQVAQWSASVDGTWDATGTDLRGLYGMSSQLQAGAGITLTQTSTTDALAVDRTTVPLKYIGAGAPGSVPASRQGDVYLNTSNGDQYVCNNASGGCNGAGAGQWVKVTGSAGSSFDPLETAAVYFRDEFGSGNAASTNTLGSLGWSGTTFGSCGAVASAVTGTNSTFTNAGLASIDSGPTSPAQGCGIFIHFPSNAYDHPPLGTIGSNANWEMVWIVKPLSTANVRIRVGACRNPSQIVPTRGLWFRYDTNASYADTTWKYETASTSSSVTDSTVTPSTSAFTKLRMWSTSSGQIQFSINGGNAATISTNIPSEQMYPCAGLATDTNAQKQMYADFFAYKATVSR